jgi:hypothetical protein
MHFDGIVLLPQNIKDVNTRVNELMTPYDHKREVEPYRCYLGDQQIAGFSHTYGGEGDLNVLLERLNEGSPGEYHLDAHGIYYIDTYNYRGRWDHWVYSGGEYMLGKETWEECQILHSSDQIEDVIACNSCPVNDLPSPFYCAAIITPDGVWHDLGDFGWTFRINDTDEGRAALARWRSHAQSLLDNCKDCLAVGIHCHD